MTTVQPARRRVVVLGSGPAGVSVAVRLVRAGVDVVLVCGGGMRESPASRALNRGGGWTGDFAHEDLAENRRRMVGGASTAWGGRCVLLDPIDFRTRSWIPDSGWPISYEEYVRWLAPASELLEIPVSDYRRPVPGDLLGPADAPPHGQLESDALEIWSPPTNFAAYVQNELLRSGRCEVLLDAHATRIRLDENGCVEGVDVHREGRTLDVCGTEYVLAAGGLENPRLLLVSGLGERLPAIGRYYMTHTFCSLFAFEGPPLAPESEFFQIDGAWARNRWRLSDHVQEQAGVGNAIGFFARPFSNQTGMHKEPLSSAVEIAKLLRDAAAAGPSEGLALLRRNRRALRDDALVVLRGRPSDWLRMARQARLRMSGRRIPIVLPDRRIPIKHLTFQGEQAPDPESRVVLCDERDALGVPRLSVHVRFSPIDFETVRVFHRVFGDFVRARGHRPLMDADEVAATLEKNMRAAFNSNAHHVGTTRMGTSARNAVTDADCLVFGTRNLYVAGSSLFPTCGHANPTLSIVMLACRLADRLARL